MNWGSVENFFAMGGQAWPMWGSYGVMLCALVAELWLLRRRRLRARQLISTGMDESGYRS